MKKHYRYVNHSRLFRLACRVLKYFLLFLVGFILICLLFVTCGMPQLAQGLIQLLGETILRFAAIVLLLMTLAVIVESLHS